jgi:hypothetical protein
VSLLHGDCWIVAIILASQGLPLTAKLPLTVSDPLLILSLTSIGSTN